MKIMFCNIAEMKRYVGQTEDDIPRRGGSHPEKHEQWNFLNYNGYCYGYVQNNGYKFDISRIDKTASRVSCVEGVTVVWCANVDTENDTETVIVGWYENATVYREYQDCICTWERGLERCYFTKAKAEDCCLLPEKLRTFRIGRAQSQGKGKGFGRSNFWYADSTYAQTKLIPKVEEFIKKNRDKGINKLTDFFDPPKNIDTPLTAKEQKLAEFYYEHNCFDSFLPFGYRIFRQKRDGDSAIRVAKALREMYQFDSAFMWYRKAIALDGETFQTMLEITYMFFMCEKYYKAVETAKKLLESPEAKEESARDMLRDIIADSYMHDGDYKAAIKWWELNLTESNDPDFLWYARYQSDRLRFLLGQ